MRLVRFRYSGRVGHFLRAEMNASALSYPVPPRTALLGLLGNILGLPKDEAPRRLGDAAIAVGGAIPRRHYHRANVRKLFLAALPVAIRPVLTVAGALAVSPILAVTGILPVAILSVITFLAVAAIL